MEREPVWSPDGQSIAYFSDESGEYALHVRNQDGTGDVTEDPAGQGVLLVRRAGRPTARRSPTWTIMLISITWIWRTGSRYWWIPIIIPRDGLAPLWSPDSQWLAYSKIAEESHGGDLFVFAGDGKGIADYRRNERRARIPVFDKSGKYLYFTASTNSGAAMEPDIERFRGR